MRHFIGERVDVRPRTPVKTILVEDNQVVGVKTEQDETIMNM